MSVAYLRQEAKRVGISLDDESIFVFNELEWAHFESVGMEGGVVVSPIKWPTIDAYWRLMGRDPNPRFIRELRHMSAAFCRGWRENRKEITKNMKNRNHPIPPEAWKENRKLLREIDRANGV